MNTADIKALAVFHVRHNTDSIVVMCEWCYKQYPISETAPVAVEIDPDTGMATEEVNVCYDCLPEHDEPVVDDGDSDESSEDRLERQAQAHLEAAARHRDDPMF